MQLCGSFSFLLTGLLFFLTQVEATLAKRSPGLVTLPLKRLPRPADVHPAVVSTTLDAPRNYRGIHSIFPSSTNSMSTAATAVTRG